MRPLERRAALELLAVVAMYGGDSGSGGDSGGSGAADAEAVATQADAAPALVDVVATATAADAAMVIGSPTTAGGSSGGGATLAAAQADAATAAAGAQVVSPVAVLSPADIAAVAAKAAAEVVAARARQAATDLAQREAEAEEWVAAEQKRFLTQALSTSGLKPKLALFVSAGINAARDCKEGICRAWDAAGWGRAWDKTFQLAAMRRMPELFPSMQEAMTAGEPSPEGGGEPYAPELPTTEADGLVPLNARAVGCSARQLGGAQSEAAPQAAGERSRRRWSC